MTEIVSDSSGKLWLSQHVYLCQLHSTVIALDLARDAYLGIAGPTLQDLAARIPGWPGVSAESGPPPQGASDDSSESVLQLIAEGILTSDGSRGKLATPVAFSSDLATVALIPNVARNRSIRIRDVANFLFACLFTVWLLKCRSLQKAVQTVAARKAAVDLKSTIDVSEVSDLIAIFRRLRSFTFNAHRRCLFHALVLMSFLSCYRVYPQFVMGVKINPWAAHSWVQLREYVLDGTPEQVRFFTPILAI